MTSFIALLISIIVGLGVYAPDNKSANNATVQFSVIEFMAEDAKSLMCPVVPTNQPTTSSDGWYLLTGYYNNGTNSFAFDCGAPVVMSQYGFTRVEIDDVAVQCGEVVDPRDPFGASGCHAG